MCVLPTWQINVNVNVKRATQDPHTRGVRGGGGEKATTTIGSRARSWPCMHFHSCRPDENLMKTPY